MNTAGGETTDWPTDPPLRPAPRRSSAATSPTAPGATPASSCSTSRTAPTPSSITHTQLVAALRRRHPQLPAAARPRPARGPRRGRARQLRGRRSSRSGCSTTACRRTRSASRPSRRRPRPTTVAKGGHFGPHNIYENRPDGFVSSETIFATYQNAGVRVFDIRDQYRPEEIAAFVPAAAEPADRPPPQPAAGASSPATSTSTRKGWSTPTTTMAASTFSSTRGEGVLEPLARDRRSHSRHPGRSATRSVALQTRDPGPRCGEFGCPGSRLSASLRPG